MKHNGHNLMFPVHLHPLPHPLNTMIMFIQTNIVQQLTMYMYGHSEMINRTQFAVPNTLFVYTICNC
jgi:hypothetical protein